MANDTTEDTRPPVQAGRIDAARRLMCWADAVYALTLSAATGSARNSPVHLVQQDIREKMIQIYIKKHKRSPRFSMRTGALCHFARSVYVVNWRDRNRGLGRLVRADMMVCQDKQVMLRHLDVTGLADKLTQPTQTISLKHFRQLVTKFFTARTCKAINLITLEDIRNLSTDAGLYAAARCMDATSYAKYSARVRSGTQRNCSTRSRTDSPKDEADPASIGDFIQPDLDGLQHKDGATEQEPEAPKEAATDMPPRVDEALAATASTRNTNDAAESIINCRSELRLICDNDARAATIAKILAGLMHTVSRPSEIKAAIAYFGTISPAAASVIVDNPTVLRDSSTLDSIILDSLTPSSTK